MMTYKDQLKTPEWKCKRDEIVSRDNHTCQLCESKVRLQVHHKEYIAGRFAWEYDNSYLITLCSKCHSNLHKKKKKPEKYVRLFEKGIDLMLTLNNSQVSTLLYVLKFVDYDTNEIVVNAARRKEIAKQSKLTINTVNCAWSKLRKLKVFMERLDRKLYLNPEYFFIGSDGGRAKTKKLFN